MIRKILFSGFGALLLVFGGVAQAQTDVFDTCLNVDGALSNSAGATCPDVGGQTGLPTGLLADPSTVSVTVGGAGAHYVGLFVDLEIDEGGPLGNTYFNEFGDTSAAGPAAGQSWEIDEPGFVFGDIFLNLGNSALDNSNAVPGPGGFLFGEDVSMALAWDFVLNAGETAFIDFILSFTEPGGFYLSHTDPDSDVTVYFWSTLRVDGGGGQVPEPATLMLLGAGLLGMGLRRRRKIS